MNIAHSPLSLDLLLDKLPGMAYHCLAEVGRPMLFVSGGARALTGYAPEQLLGRQLTAYSSLLLDHDRAAVDSAVEEAIRAGGGFQLCYRIVAADGQEKWLWEQGNAICDDQGRVCALEGFISDITDSKRAEEHLRQSEERFKNVVKATTDAVWDWDLHSDEIWWSEGIRDVFGIAEQDMRHGLGTWTNRIHPEDQARVVEGLLGTIASRLCGWSDEYRFLCADGRYAPVLDRGSVMRDAEGKAVRMVGGMSNLTERRHGEEELRRAVEQLRVSEEQYRLLFANHPHPMGVYDVATLQVLAANQSAIQHYGYTEAEFLSLHLTDLWPQGQAEQLIAYVRSIRPGSKSFICGKNRKKDGTIIDVEITSDSIDFNGRPARLVLANDVTERLRAERELLRLGRAQRMLATCSEALIRAEEESALLNEVCRIIVEIGGYRMAWVGLADEDEACTVVPRAHAGAENGYLQGIHITWNPDSELGRGPVGNTIRSGRAAIIPDLSAEPSFRPWLERAWKLGYRSVVYLPLTNRERTFGVLGLFSAEETHLGSDELSLLQTLADDLAFGINNMMMQASRRRLELAALKVAAGVSASNDEGFFQQLVANMVEAVGGLGGFVARLLPGQPLRARTVIGVCGGLILDNFDYELEGTPCAKLMSQHEHVVSDRLAEHYTCAPELLQLGARAYAGQRLDNSAGEPIGLLFVVFSEAQRQSHFITSTLQVFAARAASELERESTHARLREQASLLDKAKDAIVVHGIDNRIQFWNKGAERLYGWSAAEAVGCSIADLLYADPGELNSISQQVLEHGEWSGEIVEKRKDGLPLTVEANLTLVHDQFGQPQSIFIIKTDISQRKAAEQEILHLAFHDALTQLPNRVLLLERLQHALMVNARSHAHGALLFIDLDNFKTLNDTLGHDQGDLLLQQVAGRLLDCVRESDTVARLGGDEFVVMIENLSTGPDEAAIQARLVGEKILDRLNACFDLDGGAVYSTPSIGVALFTHNVDRVSELLKRADLAMYQAKAAGRNTLRFFDPEMQERVSSRAALEADMRHGLLEDEFVLHYQAQFDHRGLATGVEALARWHHPRLGLISPAEFIPLAEECGLIVPLGRWVLESACRQLALWAPRPERSHMVIAVNVSAHQFRHPSFVDEVLKVLDVHRVRPQLLKLELTESLLVDDMDQTIAKMSLLKQRGVTFSLDDFGTGYSSLYYLKHLPLDQLKIDQSFVRDLLSDPNDAAIVRTIITLGQSLGLAVIAEGVETEEQRDFLALHDCHAYQGFLFSRPLPLEKLEQFLCALSRDDSLF